MPQVRLCHRPRLGAEATGAQRVAKEAWLRAVDPPQFWEMFEAL